MTRIIAGEAGGRRLQTPPGDSTRPTSDRVREALFSAIESREGTLVDLRFLDVYAGSGAIGLEARSRGAAHVTAVEHNVAAAALIRSNAATLKLDRITVLTSRAEQLAAQPPTGGPFDIAFFDPPYALPADELRAVVIGLGQAGWYVDDCFLVVERPRRGGEWIWPDGCEPLRVKKYGETMLWYGRWAPSSSQDAES